MHADEIETWMDRVSVSMLIFFGVYRRSSAVNP